MSAATLTAGARRARRGTAALAVLCLAQFVLVLDAAVVAVALPAIQLDLGLTPSQVQGVGTAYALTFGGLLILAGRIADAAGARRAFVVGLSVFTAASALAAASPSGDVLVAARAVQGLGAAIASPAALVLLMAAFDGESDRTRAFAAWGAVAAGGAVAGQLIGGALTEALDWRWIFLINVPVAAGVLASVSRLPAPPARPRDRRLDVVGAALLTAAVALVVLAATQATARGVDDVVLAIAAGGLAALTLFVAWEGRTAAPLVSLGLLARREVWRGNAISFLAAGASTTVVFLTAIYLQRALSMSVLEVGLGFAPVTAAIVATSAAAAKVTERIGLGWTLAAGQVLVAAGAFMLGFVSADGSYLADALPGLALVGIGSGLTYGPAMVAATSGVAAENHGVATAVVSTMQQVGGALGLAVLSTIAFGGHGGDVAVLADADALADGFRAAIALPVAGLIVAFGLVARTRPPRTKEGI
jgi:EmrB/QacA subfamily drug resistance transporter